MKTLWTMTSPWVRALVIPIVLTTAPPVAAIEGPQDEPLALISLEFSGGSAMDYVATIRQAAGETNIVVAPEADQIRMPPVKLAQVTVAAALDLLDGRNFRRPDRTVELAVRNMPMYDTAERRIYQIVAEVMGFHESSHAQIWTVSNLLTNGIPSEAVLGAVEMALEVVGSSTELDIRFHEDTGLLIARGDQEQLEVINEVLDRLNESVRLSHQDAERGEALLRLEAAETAQRQAQALVATLQQKVEALEWRVADLQRIVEDKERQLAVVTTELGETRMRLELEKERAQRELQRERPND